MPTLEELQAAAEEQWHSTADPDSGIFRTFSFEHKQVLRSREAALREVEAALKAKAAKTGKALKDPSGNSVEEGGSSGLDALAAVQQASGKGAIGLAAAVRTLQVCHHAVPRTDSLPSHHLQPTAHHL